MLAKICPAKLLGVGQGGGSLVAFQAREGKIIVFRATFTFYTAPRAGAAELPFARVRTLISLNAGMSWGRGSNQETTIKMAIVEPRDLIFLSRRQMKIDRGEADVDPVDQRFYEGFRNYCEERAFALTGGDPGENLRPTTGFPGYLDMKIDGWQIFVPWTMVSTCPAPDVLSELVAIANGSAIVPVVSVCISGSSAWLGAEIEVGDLDFSQYVEQPSSEIVGRARTFTIPANGLALVAASYDDQEALAPWDASWPDLETVMTAHCSIESSTQRLMLEFLGGGNRYGPLPLSNVVLPSDFGDANLGAARRSFVYQELTCLRDTGTAMAPHWVLVVPEEVGRYIAFLENQISWYSASHPIKAVKRALSLARTIGLRMVAEEALAILKSPSTASYVAYKRLADFRKQLDRCGPAERDALSKAYTLPTEEPVLPESASETFERCHALVASLAQAISELELSLPLAR